MDDDLRNLGRKRGGSGSGSSLLGSPTKKTVTDPGRVQVELKCCRYSVEAKQYGAERMKADLLRATVPGFTAGLVWNIVQKKWINQQRDSVTPNIQPTCPSLELLKVLCHACKESHWCTRWYLTGRDGRTIPCSAATIDDLDIQ